MHRAVDAIYTWVDGWDPAHRAKRARYRPLLAGQKEDRARWRSNDELRYSLRSLHQHAPWLRKIYIVTDEQVPPWLDTAHPQIEIIDHTAIFPDRRFLPTFNSCAIEAFLHRIPGLSSHYLYLNDDFFLGRALDLSDLMTAAGCQILHVEASPLPPLKHLAWPRPNPHSRLLAYCRLLLRCSLGPGARLFRVPHAPQFFAKADAEAVAERFARPIAWGLRQRFRSWQMPLFRELYVNTLLNTGGAEPHAVGRTMAPGDYQFIMLNDEGGGERGLREMMANPHKFIGINDDRRNPASQPKLAVVLALALKRCFPQPSPFERG